MIPLSVPNLMEMNGNMQDCLIRMDLSAGAYVNKSDKAIQSYTGANYAIACMNGTAGLQFL